jgi:hypothetical protein
MSLYARKSMFILIDLFRIVSCNLSVYLPLLLLRENYSNSMSLQTLVDSTLRIYNYAVRCRHSRGKNYDKNVGLACQLRQLCDVREKIIRTVELAVRCSR